MRFAKTCSSAVASPKVGGSGGHDELRALRRDLPAHRIQDALDDRVEIDGLALVLDAPDAREAQQRVDDRREPRDRRLDEVDRLGDIAIDDALRALARVGVHLALQHFADGVARGAELPGEALEIHERRAEVVRDAVDEHLVFAALVIEVEVGGDELRVLLFQRHLERALVPLPVGDRVGHLVEAEVELGDLVAPLDERLERFSAGEAAGIRAQHADALRETARQDDHRRHAREHGHEDAGGQDPALHGRLLDRAP